jgi:hypothetical protein
MVAGYAELSRNLASRERTVGLSRQSHQGAQPEIGEGRQSHQLGIYNTHSSS